MQSVWVGYLSACSWRWWPTFLMPFALVGACITWKIWNELPAATKKYMADHETKPAKM